MRNGLQILTAIAGLLTAAATVNATDFTLDNIAFWVGEGANEIGIAIDWNGDDLALDNAAPSLAWGYRWDGDATAEDALRDVLAADPRLFGKLDDGGFGTVVLGLGYDLNNDGLFAIDPAEPFDPATGLSLNTEETFANSADPADAYEEGFNFNFVDPENEGFWHFATTDGPVADGFSSSPIGVSGSTLVDGTFLSLSFTPSFDFTAFANDIVAAEPPLLAPPPGDFDGDGAVTAADFVILRDTQAPAEAFAEFQANFDVGTGPIATAAFAVPEPASFVLLMISTSIGAMRRRARTV